jgi:PTS system nitrogen regulatory IIA component
MKLTVREVAKLLGVSDKTVYRWVGEGKIPVYKVNDQYRFVRSEILEWSTANRVPVSPQIFLEPEEDNKPLSKLSEALEAGRIFYRVEGHDRESVLRSVVKLLPLPADVDHDFVFELIRVREMMGSTGMGDGIAIPHPRNPLMFQSTPSVTLCFLEQPIDFDALDGKPVFALFTILSPNMRSHIHLLSRLAFALQNQAFRSIITAQAARETILNEIRKMEASFSATAPSAQPQAAG